MTRVEWPTIAVALAIYGGFAVITLNYALLPWWLFLLLAGYLVAWHGSLQHEIIHGHPTPWRAVNVLLAFPTLWLWLPFGVYRDTHLAHHRCERLTVPGEDPESFYVSERTWERMPRMQRAIFQARRCLVGRLLVGPAIMVLGFLRQELQQFRSWTPVHARHWLMHTVSVSLVLAWVWGVCGIPIAEYLLLAVYPALMLTALRTFPEHQFATNEDARVSIVESAGPLALVFLNNNLHLHHHREPRLPWYALPARHRELHAQSRIPADTPVYRGYRDVLRRYALTARQPAVHPGH